jgi:hypothetical protein
VTSAQFVSVDGPWISGRAYAAVLGIGSHVITE